MEHATFKARLELATSYAIECAGTMVLETLTTEVVYVVFPNQSYDENPRVGDEVVYPEDWLGSVHYHGPWSTLSVTNFLWRDGKVPEWIDVSVVDVDDGRTIVQLLCCGRYTGRDELLYYRDRPTPGFGIKSPNLPCLWDEMDKSEKFSLRWRNDRRPDWRRFV